MAVSVHDGNTNDAKTLMPQVDKVTKAFGIQTLVLVGDRGMISQKAIDELKECDHVAWITALKTGQIRALVDGGQLQLGLFDEKNLFELAHPDFPSERLIACPSYRCSPRTTRGKGTIRLRRARSKTKKGRVLKLTGELLDLIRRRAGLRRPECVYVFQRNGKPLRCFRISWQKACKAAGFEGRLFHDLRRSAVRNMVRAGVPQNIAMRISGHKTDSVFRRYDIVDEEDLAEALTLTQDYVDRQRHETPKVTPLRPAAGRE